MEFDEFEPLLEAARVAVSNRGASSEFSFFDSWIASDADLAHAEEVLEARLPGKYKEFMRRYGGGVFLFVELLPVVSPSGREEDLISVNSDSWFAGLSFVAVAPVGTGDWWGFTVQQGVCEDRVSFLYHEDLAVEPVASDFLEFVTRTGLNIRDR